MNDSTIRQDILDELEFDPSLDANDIGVAVEHGVVTLTGHVPSFREKMAAENAALRVKGVKGLAQKIEVRYRFGAGTSDEEIAGRAIESMKWSTMVPDDKVKVKVQHGWVTLEGTLDWNYQRIGAEDAIRNLRGVAGIINNIELRPRVIAEDVKKSIEDALKRNAAMEADSIHVEVLGTTVSLEGKVKSWGNRKVAEQAAWAIPGVKIVEDHLTLS